MIAKKYVIALVLVCAAVGGVASPSCAEDKAPKIVIPAAVYDFGSVPQGQRVVHEFEIRNTGNADLTLQRISPSCGCTAAVVSSPVIVPGASEKVKVEFDTSGFSGSKSKTIRILTSAVDTPEVTLKITGEIVRGVFVTPERLEFGELNPESSIGSRTKEFAVELAEGSDLSIVSVKSFSKYLTVTPRGGDSRKMRYSVVVREGLPKGELRERVLIDFKGDRQAGVNVPVTASMRSDLRVIPEVVSFGVVSGADVLERRIRFENKSEEKVAVQEIISSHPAVSASLKEVSPGKQGVIIVKLDPKKVSGDLRASLELKTTHPGEERLAVSVFAVQPPH